MSLISSCGSCVGFGPHVIALCPRCGGPVVHDAHTFQDRHKPTCPVFALGIAAIMSEATRRELAPRPRVRK